MFGIAGAQGQPGEWSADAGGMPRGGSRLQRHLASSVLPGSWNWGWDVGEKGRFPEKRKWTESPEDKLSDKERHAWILGKGL